MPAGRRLLALLEGWFADHDRWEPDKFAVEARRALSPPGMKSPGLRFDESLNDVALAFLRPPVAPLIANARTDFASALNFTEGDVVRYLFLTTANDTTHCAALP